MNKETKILKDLLLLIHKRQSEFYYYYDEIDHLGYIEKWIKDKIKEISREEE